MVISSLTPRFAFLDGESLSLKEERWLICTTIALLVAATAVIWRLLHTRHQMALRELQAKEEAIQQLAKEHAARLEAEQKTRVLIQRLLTAQEDERSHLARELHDDVTQRLARLAIDAARAERGMSSPPGNGSARSMHDDLARLSEDVHRLAYRLHPSILDELGLTEALRAECDQIALTHSLRVNVDLRNMPARIPRPTALCLFRVAQESLRNVIRHAQAQSVNVSLAGVDDGVQLSVGDDGVGFNPARNGHPPSLGHAGMRERLRIINGEFDIDSAEGRGTTIVAWAPLTEETAG